MHSQQDLDCIMGELSKFATDYLASKNESKKKSVTEVQPFILALLKQHTKLMLEYTDAKEEKYKEEIEKRDTKIADLKSELRDHRNEHDALACYNRRENLKIQGVEVSPGENTNEIVKEICKYAGREITDMDISTSHRNGSVKTSNELPPGMTTRANRVPDIYVRFTRRDVKTEVFEKRKNLATNSQCPDKYRNVSIYEDVTPLRSRIMYELRQRNDKQAFKFVWSRGGRIFCRTPEEANMTTIPKPHVINKPEDLLKVGFSEDEVEKIILNKRD